MANIQMQIIKDKQSSSTQIQYPSNIRDIDKHFIHIFLSNVIPGSIQKLCYIELNHHTLTYI